VALRPIYSARPSADPGPLTSRFAPTPCNPPLPSCSRCW